MIKKWLIIFGLIIISVFLVIFFKDRADKGYDFKESDSGFRYSEDVGSVGVNYTKNPDFGIAIYPNSVPIDDNSSATVELNEQDMVVGSYKTSDSEADVVRFFIGQIPNSKSGEITDFQGQTAKIISSSDSSVSVMVKSDGIETTIVIIKI